jgi:hypothetical protein
MNRGALVSLCAGVVLGLIGCSGSDSGSSSAASSPTIAVSYVDGDSIPAVAVVVTHPQSVASVELVAPDGRYVAAPLIERDVARGPGTLSPTVGVGVFGGSGGGFGTGLGLGFPLGGSPSPPVTGNRARARLVIPDPDAYRRDWEKYIVRVRFGTAPEPVMTADVPAPAPRR